MTLSARSIAPSAVSSSMPGACPWCGSTFPLPAAFTLEPCQRAYQAACTLADEGKPIDPVTVGRTAGLEREFLVQCMEIVPSCDGASQYAAAVAEGYRRRQLQEIGNRLQAGAQQLDTDGQSQLLSQARSALDTMAEAPGGTIAKTTADSLYSFLDFRAEVNAGTRQTVKTGFTGIDNILGGFAEAACTLWQLAPALENRLWHCRGRHDCKGLQRALRQLGND